MLGNRHQSSLGFKDYLMNIKLLIEHTNSFSDAYVIQLLQIGNKLNQKVILPVYGFLRRPKEIQYSSNSDTRAACSVYPNGQCRS